MANDTKKPDLRDQIRVKTSVTNTDSEMAGGEDRRDTVMPRSEFNELTPDIGKGLAEGQVTKSS